MSNNKFDVVIIGTGFGGAIMAHDLAEKGMRVLMLERGRDITNKDNSTFWSALRDASSYSRYSDGPWHADQYLHWNPEGPERSTGIFDFNKFHNISTLSASGVGGGSIIFGNVFTLPPDTSFDQGWPADINFYDLFSFFSKNKEILRTQQIPENQRSQRSRLVSESAAAIGEGHRYRKLDLTIKFSENLLLDYDVDNPASIPQRSEITDESYPDGEFVGACVHAGDCSFGCPYNAKRTLAHQCIPIALKRGAELRELHHVLNIGPYAGGYRVTYENLSNRERTQGYVDAKRVVVAAGSIGSTELLLKCKLNGSLRGLSPRLGHGWSANGYFVVPTFFADGNVFPSVGPHITGTLDFMDGVVGGQKFWIEDGGFPRAATAYLRRWLKTSNNGPWESIAHHSANAFLEQARSSLYGNGDELINNVMQWTIQGIDPSNGQISLSNGKLAINWDIRSCYPLFQAATSVIEKMCSHLGASIMVPFANSPPSHMVTAQPLGGCNMGNNWSDGVVDHSGEVFGCPGLYVADGAIFPRALGCPPSATIAAIAARAAHLLVENDCKSSSKARQTLKSKDSMLQSISDSTINDSIVSINAEVLKTPNAGTSSSICIVSSRAVPDLEPLPSLASEPFVAAQRYLVARADDSIRMGVPFMLMARIATDNLPSALGQGGVAITGDVSGKLRISIFARDFFAKDGTQREIEVPAVGNSTWVSFELVAKNEGVQQIEVLAWKNSAQVAGVTISIAVGVAAITPEQVQTKVVMRDPDEGEYTLEVEYEKDQHKYRFQLRSDTGENWPPMHSDALIGTNLDAYSNTIARLNEQARNASNLSEYAQTMWLKGMGATLYNSLIPSDLKTALWENRGKIRFLNILSQAEPMPWELLYISSPGNASDGEFIADAATISRSRFGPLAERKVSTKSPYFILPNASPTKARDEVNYIRQKFATGDIIGELDDLLRLLDAGQFTFLHFASHNVADPTATTGLYIPFGRAKFDVTFMRAWSKTQFRKQSPLVFMNSCTSGGAVPLYTEMAGWAECFLGSGCAAFIGSLWEIRDESALVFAKHFYDEVTSGKNLGQAMRTARNALGTDNPTHFAYTLYGDPRTQIL